MIELNVPERRMQLLISDEELKARLSKWVRPEPPLKSGYWKLYVDTVLQADEGCDLDFLVGKRGAFVPKDIAGRTETLNWLFWQMGSAPILGGGFGHFYAYAPTKQEYPINRFAMEVKRQMDVLDRHLAANEYMAGSDYSIADMAIWPWYGAMSLGLLYEAGEFLDVAGYTNVIRWTKQIGERPAVKRGRMVNKVTGEPSEQVRERHDASDFDGKTLA